MNILLLSLEDREAMPDWYKCNLEAAGFSVMSMMGDGLFNLINDWRPDVVLVSPDVWSNRDNITAQVLKTNPATRDILVVEMLEHEEEDVCTSHQQGFADAVIPYTKNPLNLAVQLQNLLAKHSPPLVAQSYSSGDLTLSDQMAGIYGPKGLLPLSRTECRLLDYLMRRPQRAFSRRQLLHAVSGMGTHHQVRTLDVYMARLRRVLSKAGVSPALQTMRGVGYAFMSGEDQTQPSVSRHKTVPPTEASAPTPMRMH